MRNFLLAVIALLLAVLVAERFVGMPWPRAGITENPSPIPEPLPLVIPDTDIRVMEVFDRVSPSVVSVANKALVRAGWFSTQLYEVPQGAGSGFVWDAHGHILTNYHVVRGASALTVTFPDGQSYEAELVGSAPDYDVSVLKIEAPGRGLVPVLPGVSRNLQVGQSVLAIGNPFGLDTSLSKGIVSALGRTMDSISGRRISDVVQTDAAINPGNSGGPLLDMNGRLIGINTAIKSPSGASAGIGFAVPVDTVARIAPQLIEKGRITRAGIGVKLVAESITRNHGLKGVAIEQALPGSPAEKAGLEGIRRVGWGQFLLGDIIIALNGKPVQNKDDLLDMLDAFRPGDSVELTVADGRGNERQVTLTLVDLAVDTPMVAENRRQAEPDALSAAH